MGVLTLLAKGKVLIWTMSDELWSDVNLLIQEGFVEVVKRSAGSKGLGWAQITQKGKGSLCQ